MCIAGAGLYGRFPDVLDVIASKFQTLELRNTSLMQCNASHVDSLANAANGTVQSQYACMVSPKCVSLLVHVFRNWSASVLPACIAQHMLVHAWVHSCSV